MLLQSVILLDAAIFIKINIINYIPAILDKSYNFNIQKFFILFYITKRLLYVLLKYKNVYV